MPHHASGVPRVLPLPLSALSNSFNTCVTAPMPTKPTQPHPPYANTSFTSVPPHASPSHPGTRHVQQNRLGKTTRDTDLDALRDPVAQSFPLADQDLESKAELDALLSIEQLVKVPFLILGGRLMYRLTALSDMRPIEILMCLVVLRQGNGVEDMRPIEILCAWLFCDKATALSDMCPIEIFMCSVVLRQGDSVEQYAPY